MSTKYNLANTHLHTPSLTHPHPHTYIATVIDEASQTSSMRSVNNIVMVNTEQVTTANTGSLVPSLSLVGNGLPHNFSHVLNHHLIRRDGLQRKQTPVVNGGLGKLQLLLSCLLEGNGNL